MPVVTPVAMPVVAPIVAIAVLLLVQVPPLVPLVNVVVPPTHIVVDAGVIAVGVGLMVMLFIAAQPEPIVYDIVVVPADTAVTTPLLFIVATPVLLLLQVPPPVASARVVVAPTQRVTGVPGVIAAGLLFYGESGGTFAAADAKTGKTLWHFNTGQVWKASPMTYTAKGRQYVAIAAGGNILAFTLGR